MHWYSKDTKFHQFTLFFFRLDNETKLPVLTPSVSGTAKQPQEEKHPLLMSITVPQWKVCLNFVVAYLVVNSSFVP